ncbi:DUF4238 domain-containing protein [Stieleria sp. TO1_6]|uniref:DUF4238 domain-containing protein n=1 Tax=Stieleria tagensis TaxID=2956795 RepID=UPI00209AA33F|nr:DUF4238 domain-containing protein [Stieleria tagensis]MCO8122597.1 DUF4238 domain-containing protein [Stieleria tagensis]
MNQPIKHHYVPQFYLAGFTKADQKDSVFYVFDKVLRKTWESNPKATGFAKNFHRIENAAGGDEMVIEKKLAIFEGKWASILKEVIEQQRLPEGEAFEELMMFVAFMAARVPNVRNAIATFMGDVHKSMIQIWCSTPEGRSSLRKTLGRSGENMSDAEFDDFVRYAKGGEYDITLEQTFYVKQIFEIGIPLTELLKQRSWRLWSVARDAPDLICSDNPVVPSWIVPPASMLIPPAFGMRNTIVSVPLHRRLALVGAFDEGLPEKVLDSEGVAAFNSVTSHHANQIFSSEPASGEVSLTL